MASTYPCTSTKILPKCQRETCLRQHLINSEFSDPGVLYNTLPSYRNCHPVEYGSFCLKTSAFTLPNNAQLSMNNTLPLATPLLVTNIPNSSRLQGKSQQPADAYRETCSSLSLVALADEVPQDLWAGSLTLRRTAKPNLENERHRENSLRLCILEARGLTQKRRYYCDVCLDRTLYARTTSKTAVTPGIFWAEEFDLNNLPNVSVVTVSLYREADFGNKEGRRFGTVRIGSKKYRKSQNQLVGFITIPTSEIAVRNDIQSWFTLQQVTDASCLRDPYIINPLSFTAPSVSNLVDTETGTASGLRRGNSCLIHQSAPSAKLSSNMGLLTGSGGASATNGGSSVSSAPELRLRARYLSLEVLPIRDYLKFKTLVLEHGLALTSWLEPLLTVRGKEESASCLVVLHECNGLLVSFLTKLVIADIAKLESDSMAFRSNTIATKAVECFVKLAALPYLYSLLYRLVHNVLACMVAWEVNPEKLISHHSASNSLTRLDGSSQSLLSTNLGAASANSTLVHNQTTLLHHLRLVWSAVQASLPRFPSQLIKVFSSFRTALEPSRGTEFCDNLISSCIFLRLICPALLSPSLFGLVSSFPSEPACQRNLTLLAKSLQSLANFTTFDDKEPYMRFLNGYVTTQLPAMRSFIRSISTPDTTQNGKDSNSDCPSGLSIHLSTGQETRLEEDDGLRDALDEGYELASLHSILVEVCNSSSSSSLVLPLSRRSLTPGSSDNTNTEKVSYMDSLPDQLVNLPACVEELTHLLLRPEANKLASSNPAKLKQTVRLEPNTTIITDSASVKPMNSSKTASRSLTPELLLRGNKEFRCGDQRFAHLCATDNSDSGTQDNGSYYTLHRNPGVRIPGTTCAGTNTSDSLLIHPATSSNRMTAEQSSAVLELTAIGGVCPATTGAFSDYDEPYVGPPSDAEDEEALKKLSVAAHNSEKLLLATQPNQISADGEYSEPIYDFVPLSDSSSSMDELVEVNKEDLRSQSPPTGKEESADNLKEPTMIQNPVGTSFLAPTEVSTRVALSDPTVLSPRLVPKQVTTASLRLTGSNKLLPDKLGITPSPTVNGDSLSSEVQPSSIQSVPNPGLPTVPLSSDHQLATSHRKVPALTSTLAVERQPHEECTIPKVSVASDHPVTLPVTPECCQISSVRLHTGGGHSVIPTITDDVQNEVTRLRRQLQQSQAAAVWATNRLSQKEAELLRLRSQILEQQQLLQKQQQLPTAADIAISAAGTSKVALSSTLVTNSPVSCGSASNDSGSSSRSLPKAPREQPVDGKIATATFDDLDDAMARLEQEQAELLQEQVRIRARLAASRRKTTPLKSPTATFPMTTLKSHTSMSMRHQPPRLQSTDITAAAGGVDCPRSQPDSAARRQPPPLLRKNQPANSYSRRS